MKKIFLKKVEYNNLGQFDKGGNGKIYKLEKDGVYFALKLVNYKNNKQAKRFENECKFAYETNHKRIAKCLDYGRYDDPKNKKEKTYYSLMPLYDSNLRKFMNENHSAEEKLKVCYQICEALAYIHGRNIIHRDIKPENILISKKGEIALADFGIAHFDDYKLTKLGRPLANFTYRSPEQLIGNDQVSISTDIYSFGLIINEMFTGQVPQGNNHTKISEINVNYSELDELVERMILQNIEERLSDANVIQYILETIINETNENLFDIKDNLARSLNPTDMKDEDLDNILSIASYDILLAKNFLYNDREKLDSADHNYNMIVNYRVSNFLLNLSVQENILRECIDKFNYESNQYRHTKPKAKTLDLSKKEDSELYDEMSFLLGEFYVEDKYDLSGQILKYFSSCKDYHCQELLIACKERVKEVKENLLGSPILWIFNHLRRYLTVSLKYLIINSFNIEFEIFIDWEQTLVHYSSGENFQLKDAYQEDRINKNIEALNLLKNKYPSIVFDFSRKNNSASVYFPDERSFNEFKSESLEMAKPYYVFEGDVLDILKVKRRGKKCIVIHLGFFDIENIVPKLLGLKEI